MRIRAELFLALAIFAPLTYAQSLTVDHATRSQLLLKAKDLKQSAASGNGSANITLATYPNHYTMLAYRNQNGSGEVHEQFADFFVILQGNATLVTGGKLVNPSTTKPGELHGTAVEGGTETALNEGDVVHIPAHLPHQILVKSGQDFIYYVVKIREE
jgi:mannose-6-phosphate isomerase-like protein (cupin superfamily)